MYRGKLPPVLSDMQGNTDSVVHLPAPLRNQRKEDFIIETKKYTNIYGKQIVGQTRYRFEASYKFGEVDANVLARCTALADNSTIIKWIPHSDFPHVNFMCTITELKIPPLKGVINRDSLEIKLEGVDYIYHIPNADNMYGGFFLNKIGHHEQIT